jgi:hypothetical protein
VSSDLDWHYARFLAEIVKQHPPGVHRSLVDEQLSAAGLSIVQQRTAFGLAYSRGWVDVCQRYLTRPPGRRAA